LTGARLLAWFRYLAPLFIELGLFLAGLAGLSIGLLLLLLLARFLPAAALLTTLLVLLIASIGHQITPCYDMRNNAVLTKNVPAPT